jgi:hypothetical protein
MVDLHVKAPEKRILPPRRNEITFQRRVVASRVSTCAMHAARAPPPPGDPRLQPPKPCPSFASGKPVVTAAAGGGVNRILTTLPQI